MDTDQNHNHMDIWEFGLENVPDLSSTNEWEEFAGDIDFGDIAAGKPMLYLGRDFPRNT